MPCVAAPEVLRRNHLHACRLGLPWLTTMPARSVPLAIVAGGPSASEEMDTLRAWPGDIMAINGAYGWLLRHGLPAEWVLGIDPMPILARCYSATDPVTHFVIASVCDPAVFRCLGNHPVTLCDVRQGDVPGRPGDVPGGPTALTRAPQIALVLGYREVVLFGADSCFETDSHVYGHDAAAQTIEIEAGGRTWRTTRQLLQQAQYLAELLPALQTRLRIGIAGDNLTTTLLNLKGKQNG